MHMIADCVELRKWLPQDPQQLDCKAGSLRSIVRELVVLFLPMPTLEIIAKFLCVTHSTILSQDRHEDCRQLAERHRCESLHPGLHPHQPYLSHYVARIARKVTTNMDLTAEARLKPSADQNAHQNVSTESEHSFGQSDVDQPVFFQNAIQMTAMKKIKILHLMIQTCLRLCQSLQYLQVNSFCPLCIAKKPSTKP